MIKKIKYLLLLILTIFLNKNTVLANDNDNIIDFNKTGTITITISDDTTKIKGVELTIYEVANATSIDNNLTFINHENIKDCEADLSNLENEKLVKEIDKCIINTEVPFQTKITNSDGVVYFDELRLGMYLVKQTNQVEGYSNIDSFLVILPEVIDNKWNYDIKAIPKTDIIRLMDLSVKKVWNDSTNLESHPNNVTIELYKGNELIDTIILNEDNDWNYTWKDIEKSDKYSVKEINIPKDYIVNYRREGNIFIVTNTKVLAKTGINILLIKLLGVIGITFIIIGIIFERSKKHE